MEEKIELTGQERKKGQKFALLANIFTPLRLYVMTGALMILYAGDVLGLPALQISRILALIPLVSLICFVLLRLLTRVGKTRLIRSSTLINSLIIITPILTYLIYVYIFIKYTHKGDCNENQYSG